MRVLFGRQGAILRAVATAWRWRGDGQRPDSDSSAHALALQAIAAACRKLGICCILLVILAAESKLRHRCCHEAI